MRILVTGANGFAGVHLLERLRREPALELLGWSRSGQWLPGFADLEDAARLERIDWTDQADLRSRLLEFQPEAIFHLAGYSNPAASFREPEAAWAGNWHLTFRLLTALVDIGLKPRVLLASSGAIYGEAVGTITESTELRPGSPYATSKAAADLMAYQMHRSHGLPIIRARLFNVCGPGLPATFALGEFTRQLVAIERGEQEPILKHGNLEAERDYLDIRDVAEAYWQLLQHGQPGEAYNLARGEAQPMRYYLDLLAKECRRPVRTESEAARLRPTETRRLQVETLKLRATISWQPRIDILVSLREQLEFARG